MAAAKILVGGSPNPRCQRVTLPTKPYSRPSKLLCSTIIHSQPTKIRSFSIRARDFSVRACGRADNDKLLLSDVRKRPIDGFDFSRRRATIGDVMSKDSFCSNQALDVVDINGRLQVWDVGVFHKNLTLKLLSIKIESLLEKGKMAMVYLMRVSFWVSLAASSSFGLVTAFLLAFVLRIIACPRASEVMDGIRTAHLFLVNGVFSYAFRNDDPNQGIEEKRWKMIGQYIALNDGVVAAEEIAPYLDHETTGKMDNDSYMLPVLQKFDGQPKVDEEGNILYHFPSVQCTPLRRTNSREKEYAGRRVDQDIKVDKFLEEHQWEFNAVDDGSLDYISFLLRYNLFSSVLWGYFKRPVVDWEVCYFFIPLLRMYLFYAASFLVISLIRWPLIEKRNAEIVKRNEAREERAKSLESPDHSLMRKLSSARAMARRASIGNDRIVYGSGSDLYEQQDYERREWDQSRGGHGSEQPVPGSEPAVPGGSGAEPEPNRGTGAVSAVHAESEPEPKPSKLEPELKPSREGLVMLQQIILCLTFYFLYVLFLSYYYNDIF